MKTTRTTVIETITTIASAAPKGQTRRGTGRSGGFYPRTTEPRLTTSPLVGACSQCERPLPADPAAIELWRHGLLFLAGELDAAAAALLVCPDCVEEEQSSAFDEGGEE